MKWLCVVGAAAWVPVAEGNPIIRQTERTHGLGHVPILALTPHAAKAQHNQCLASGMDAVITKPVNLSALLAQIAAAIAPAQAV